MILALAALGGCGGHGDASSGVCDPDPDAIARIGVPRAAGCRVVDGGELLLVQGTSGRWSIPGGYVEASEDGPTGAARETWEEAGVRVAAGAPVCAVVDNRFVAYACTLDAPRLAVAPRPDGRETLDARFMSADAVAALASDAFRFPAQRATYLAWLGR